MNWELFWAALGSLSTMAACIIALFQPTFQKIITKKKIITSFRTDMEAVALFAPDINTRIPVTQTTPLTKGAAPCPP